MDPVSYEALCASTRVMRQLSASPTAPVLVSGEEVAEGADVLSQDTVRHVCLFACFACC